MPTPHLPSHPYDTPSLAEAEPLLIATHDGPFHADDVFGVAILRAAFQFLRPRRDARILRTRDPELLATAHFTVDVGDQHDGHTRFDHHQAAGAGSREDGVPYAASGLVWARYGRALLEDILPNTPEADQLAVHRRVDTDLIRHLDAIDNGVLLGPHTGMSISELIAQYNPTWLEAPVTAATYQAAFDDATEVAHSILVNACHTARSRILARTNVLLAGCRQPALQPKAVLLLAAPDLPWEDTVTNEMPEVQFVVYPANGARAAWHVQAVPERLGAFTVRKPLPQSWAGLREDELSHVANVPGCIFAHRGRWIAGNSTREGALLMAQRALETPRTAC